MPAKNSHKKSKKNITEKDLAETRAEILKAAEELDQRMNERLEWAKNWQTVAGHYPIEAVTGLFTIGFLLGSGIFGEIMNTAFLPKTIAKRKDKRRHSNTAGAFTLIRRALTPAITALVLNRAKKKAS